MVLAPSLVPSPISESPWILEVEAGVESDSDLRGAGVTSGEGLLEWASEWRERGAFGVIDRLWIANDLTIDKDTDQWKDGMGIFLGDHDWPWKRSGMSLRIDLLTSQNEAVVLTRTQKSSAEAKAALHRTEDARGNVSWGGGGK